MNQDKTTGLLFIFGAVLLLIPYTMLSIQFEYPDVLRQDTGVVLEKFHHGGASLIWICWAIGFIQVKRC